MPHLALHFQTQTDLLTGVRDQGFVIPNSCNDGRCGACVGTLISGEIQRERPEIFLDETPQDDAFLACCCSASDACVVSFEKLYPDIFPTPRTMVAKIKMIEAISEGMARFRVRMRPGTNFDYIAGQYVAISAAGISPRLYSIASYDGHKEQFDLIISKVDTGAMSEFLFTKPDDEKLITLTGPNGSFHLPDQTVKSVICYATGSGIAPILAILDKLKIENDAREQLFTVFWGYRYKDDGNIALEPLYPQVKFVRFCSRDDDPRSAGSYVSEIDFDKYYDAESLYLACGNPNMISALSHKLSDKGFDMANFNYDNFFVG